MWYTLGKTLILVGLIASIILIAGCTDQKTNIADITKNPYSFENKTIFLEGSIQTKTVNIAEGISGTEIDIIDSTGSIPLMFSSKFYATKGLNPPISDITLIFDLEKTYRFNGSISVSPDKRPLIIVDDSTLIGDTKTVQSSPTTTQSAGFKDCPPSLKSFVQGFASQGSQVGVGYNFRIRLNNVDIDGYQNWGSNTDATIGCRPGSNTGENINYIYCYSGFITLQKTNIDQSGNILGKDTMTVNDFVLDSSHNVIQMKCQHYYNIPY